MVQDKHVVHAMAHKTKNIRSAHGLHNPDHGIRACFSLQLLRFQQRVVWKILERFARDAAGNTTN